MGDFLLGVDGQAVVDGALGGVVTVFALRTFDPFDALGSIVVGAILGGILWPLTFHWLSWVPVNEAMAQVITGMGGIGIAKGIIEVIRNAPLIVKKLGDGK